MKLLALAIFLSSVLIAGAIVIAAFSASQSDRYEFSNVGMKGFLVWRLDKRTGEVALCRAPYQSQEGGCQLLGRKAK